MNIKNRLIKALVSALKPRSPNWGEEKRFLILSTTGLGDTLWGTPAIRALRDCFPDSYIGILTSPMGKNVLQHNPRIDELFVVKDPATSSFFSLFRKLKSRKITHVLSFHTSQRLMLPLAAMIGAQQILGTRGINKGLDSLLSHPLDQLPVHEIQRRLQIAAEVGAHTLDASMELFLSPEDESEAEKFLSSLQIPSYLPLIALHPGAKDGYKLWPASHFIDLGNRLAQNLGCCIIVTGAGAEKPLVQSIASSIRGAIAATDLSLLGTAALIKRMDLMISNDTGPMHLALAMKIPIIGLFVPTDPALCGPHFVDAAHAIAKKPTCTPCLRKKCREPFCLLQIGVQEVYDSALKLFYETKGKKVATL